MICDRKTHLSSPYQPQFSWITIDTGGSVTEPRTEKHRVFTARILPSYTGAIGARVSVIHGKK